MAVARTRLSSKGQVVIPKEMREALRWKTGHELTVVATESGILLRSSAPKESGMRLEDLRGFIDYEGPPIPIEDLCKPVDYSIEEEKPEKGVR